MLKYAFFGGVKSEGRGGTPCSVKDWLDELERDRRRALDWLERKELESVLVRSDDSTSWLVSGGSAPLSSLVSGGEVVLFIE